MVLSPLLKTKANAAPVMPSHQLAPSKEPMCGPVANYKVYLSSNSSTAQERKAIWPAVVAGTTGLSNTGKPIQPSSRTLTPTLPLNTSALPSKSSSGLV